MDESFVVGGKMTAEELRAAVEAKGIKGIVQLAEWPEPLGKDLSAASGVGAAFSAVPVSVPGRILGLPPRNHGGKAVQLTGTWSLGSCFRACPAALLSTHPYAIPRPALCDPMLTRRTRGSAGSVVPMLAVVFLAFTGCVVAAQAEDGFSAGAADGACKAIADAERPTLVLCASGARASAAVSIFQAREHHTTPQDAVADGIARNLKWADMAVLRHWVITGIQAEESRRLVAVHTSLRRVSEDLFAGGTMSADELRAAVTISGVRTVIQLVPFPEPFGESLRDALPETVATEFVPAGPPSSEYSAEAAARAIAKVQGAAKPVLVVCVSGNRAEALADMASAEAEGLNATQLAERATAAGRVWPTRGVVADWVKVTLPVE